MLENTEIFRTLMDSLQEGVYFVDRNRVIQYWNKCAERITGYTADEVVGKSCKDDLLVHVDPSGKSLCKSKCPLVFTMQDGENRSARVYLRHKDGQRMPVQVNVSPVRDEQGNIIGGLETFVDATPSIAALEEMERLKDLAFLCPLTGVGNRRYSEITLEQKLEEMKRSETRLAVLFIDVDRFKFFNDKYGHAVGDLVLKMVTRTMMGALRGSDFIGRWAGDEFIVIMPNLRPLDLEMTANRLRILVQRSTRQASEGKIQATISVGAYMCKSEDTMKTVLDAVDQIMYVSKEKGRNRVTVGGI